MIEWGFAFEVFFISILGTFFAMGVLTCIIKILGIFFTYYADKNDNLQD